MKSKYKVIPNGFGDYNLSKNGNIAAMHMSKHMAYKIKSALEIVENDDWQECFMCVHKNKSLIKMPCNKCKTTNCIKIKSHFQPKEKK